MREVARSAHSKVNARDVQNADGVEGEKLNVLRGAKRERVLQEALSSCASAGSNATVSSRAAVACSRRAMQAAPRKALGSFDLGSSGFVTSALALGYLM